MSNFVSVKDLKISCIQIYISYIKYYLYIRYYVGLVHDSMDMVSLAVDRIGMFVLVSNRWNRLRIKMFLKMDLPKHPNMQSHFSCHYELCESSSYFNFTF